MDEEEPNDEEEESGNESEEDNDGDMSVEDVEDDQGDLDTEILDLVKKVQKICRKYKKSNVLNDELQEKVKAAFGKELQLKLDCKYRQWRLGMDRGHRQLSMSTDEHMYKGP